MTIILTTNMTEHTHFVIKYLYQNIINNRTLITLRNCLLKG
jgi:hypothetical protein